MRLLAACLMLCLAPAALAQADYPNRPLRLIVTVPPGGAADFIARLAGAKLAESLGQPVLVENRGGAGGTIAADAVAKAAPDGYTLLQNSITTHGVGPHLYSKLPYDPVRDFVAVGGIQAVPIVLTAAPKTPASSFNEFLSLARAKPGAVSIASAGSGSSNHLAIELFMRMSKSAEFDEFLSLPAYELLP